MNKKCSVAYATDNNYAQHVAVSLVSLFENTNIALDVYVLADHLASSHMLNLLSIGRKYEQNIIFISVDNLTSILKGYNVAINNLSISTYSRLFLSVLLPETVERVLYLDCDTVIVDDISFLWSIPMYDYFIGGVIDTMFPNYKKDIFLPEDKYYVNAGVLLIDLTKWRCVKAEQLFTDFINKFNGNVPHLDQGVINGVFHDKLILDLKYNVQTPVFLIKRYMNILRFFSLANYYSSDEVASSKAKPVIIHYSSFFADRPWFEFCLHPRKKRYLNYLEMTPYKDCKLIKNPKRTFRRKIKSIFFVYFQSLYFFMRK